MPLLVGLDLSASNLGACIPTHIALRYDWLCCKQRRHPQRWQGERADADAPLMTCAPPPPLPYLLFSFFLPASLPNILMHPSSLTFCSHYPAFLTS